jgi:putative ABC transport system substrate-binding protein
VAITSIVEHPALDIVINGIRQGLADSGYADGTDLTITYESARGNPATAARIAQRYVSHPPDLIVAISTPSAQAVAAATNDIPIIFSAVTDPLAARLVASLDAPGGNVTGVSDHTRASDILALIGEITPEVRRLGILFNPDEANSTASRTAISAAAEAAGMIVVDAAVHDPAQVAPVARSIVGRVDAIFAPNDNTVVQAFEAAAELAIEANLPLYAADPENVGRGALAALGVDYHQIGTLTATLVDRVLKGENPGDIPVVFASGVNLHLNRNTATAIGRTFTQSTLDRAARVVE